MHITVALIQKYGIQTDTSKNVAYIKAVADMYKDIYNAIDSASSFPDGDA